jgi:DNA (cytosine-5)-methyltransferase 1
VGDVSNTDEMLTMVSGYIGKNFDGLFLGGPPCQPFSIASNQRFNKNGKNFKRIGFAHKTNGNLLFDYIDMIKHFLPRAFLIENVPGLIDIDGGEQIENAYRELESCGYNVNQPLILKADDFSVPQQRIRLFIVGNRINKDFKAPKSAYHGLPVGPVFNLPIHGVENHVTREHAAESILRYMVLDYGCRDKLGRVDRLDPRLPSKTVIAGGTAGGGRSHLHPYIPRTLSVRECARIQTFPDNYIFKGPVARQFTQVGNAVPPVLAAQLGTAILKSFFLS